MSLRSNSAKSLTGLIKPFKPVFVKPTVLYFKRAYPSLLSRALTVFVYHDISDNPSEFSCTYRLNVSPRLFDYQLCFIKNHFNIISVDDLVENKIPPKAAIITFDDGFRSFFTNAIPILEKHSIPCQVFLNMGPVKKEVFWSGLIAYLCGKRQDFTEYLRSRVKRAVRKRDLFLLCSEEVVYSYLGQIGDDLSDQVSTFVGDFATEEDLERAADKDFVFYGNHLFNHYVPLLMSDRKLMESFRKNKDELETYPNYRNTVAMPFGQPGSCFSERQVYLLLRNGAMKVFRSSGSVNYDTTASYLDRIPLTSWHNSAERIWFQIFRHCLSLPLRKSKLN